MNHARLFFALWPDEAEAQAAVAAGRDLLVPGEARPVPRERIHMTLLFLGSVATDLHSAIIAAAGRVRGLPFDLRLDVAGYWRRPRVAWLAPASPPAALTDLHERLRASMLDLGLDLESRAFRPHVTLARKAKRAPNKARFAPLLWHINSFGLYQSVTHASGPEYRPLRQFALAASAE